MDMNRRDALKGLGVAAGLTVGSALAPRWTAAQANEIPVGSLLDGTGPINIYGLPMIDAAKFAVDDINAQGGVLGKKLRLIQLDAQSNNQIYAQYATKLLLEDKVAVLMGGSPARRARRSGRWWTGTSRCTSTTSNMRAACATSWSSARASRRRNSWAS